MYRKSYTGLVVSMCIFFALVMIIPFLPGADVQVSMRLILLVTAWYMAALTLHVWRTEQVYWYNGISFEEAEAAGSERRKEFAWKHVKMFGMVALILTAVSCGTYLLGWSAWIDFFVGMAGIIVAACCTIPFKL